MSKGDIHMTLVNILAIAAWAAIYGLIGKWIIGKMIEEEQKSERSRA